MRMAFSSSDRDATDIGRGDDVLRCTETLGEMVDEHRTGAEMIHRNAERIVERRRVVDVKGHEPINSRGLEQLRNLTRVFRAARLSASVFARISAIGHERDHCARTGIAETEEQEQTTGAPAATQPAPWRSQRAIAPRTPSGYARARADAT